MKSVKLFYLKNCPFCKKALRYIEELKAEHAELAAVDIVPTFYVDGVKEHEGGIYPEEVERILRKALE